MVHVNPSYSTSGVSWVIEETEEGGRYIQTSTTVSAWNFSADNRLVFYSASNGNLSLHADDIISVSPTFEGAMIEARRNGAIHFLKIHNRGTWESGGAIIDLVNFLKGLTKKNQVVKPNAAEDKSEVPHPPQTSIKIVPTAIRSSDSMEEEHECTYHTIGRKVRSFCTTTQSDNDRTDFAFRRVNGLLVDLLGDDRGSLIVLRECLSLIESLESSKTPRIFSVWNLVLQERLAPVFGERSLHIAQSFLRGYLGE